MQVRTGAWFQVRVAKAFARSSRLISPLSASQIPGRIENEMLEREEEQNCCNPYLTYNVKQAKDF